MSWVRGGPLTGFGEYAEPASPLGEGEERRPRQRGDSLTRCSGVVGCAEGGWVSDAAPAKEGDMGRVVRMRAVRCPWRHGRKMGGSGIRP